MKKYSVSLLKLFLLNSLFLLPQLGYSQNIRLLEFGVHNFVYASATDRVYGISSEEEPRLVKINPYFAQLEQGLDLGGLDASTQMAVSDTGNLLYLGNASEVICFNLETEEVVYQFDLPVEDTLRSFTRHIAVLPSQPNAVLVVWEDLSNPEGNWVAIFDNGIMRQDAFATNTVIQTFLNSLGTTAYLVGFPFLAKSTIDEMGIRLDSIYTDVLSPNSADAAYFQNKLYYNNGWIVDLSAEHPSFYGTLDPNFSYEFLSTSVTVDSFLNHFYVIEENFGQPALARFDLSTGLFFDRIELDFNSFTSIYGLINWGEGKTAFRTARGEVGFVRFCTAEVGEDIAIVEAPSITGCIGDSIVLHAEGTAFQYYWPDGSNADSLAVYPFSNHGTYQLRGVDSTGCIGMESSPVEVQFESYPSTPIIRTEDALRASDTIRICKNDSLLLTISLLEDDIYIKYRWSTGDTTASIIIKEEGDYSAQYITPLGACISEWSDTIHVEILPDSIPPKPEVTFSTGSEMNCQGDTIQLQVAGDYAFYEWKDNYLTTGATRPIFFSGDYAVRVITAFGCTSPYSDFTSVQINPSPPQPSIMVNNFLLASTASEGNQWYLNGIPIFNANSQFFTATENGFYQVSVSLGDCESALSEAVEIVISHTQEMEDISWQIIPNPVKDQISFRHLPSMANKIRLIDTKGRLIETRKINDQSSFNLGNLSRGTYLLELLDAKGQRLNIFRFIKM